MGEEGGLWGQCGRDGWEDCTQRWKETPRTFLLFWIQGGLELQAGEKGGSESAVFTIGLIVRGVRLRGGPGCAP